MCVGGVHLGVERLSLRECLGSSALNDLSVEILSVRNGRDGRLASMD